MWLKKLYDKITGYFLEREAINSPHSSNSVSNTNDKGGVTMKKQRVFQTKAEPSAVVQAGGGKVLATKGKGKSRQTRFAYQNKKGEVFESKNGAPVQKVTVKAEARGEPDKLTIERERLTRQELLAQRQAYKPIGGQGLRLTPKVPRLR